MGPWSFVGRAAELNRLIAAATDEGARGLIFSGTAGIGKSRLLREGVATLDTDRYAVWARHAPTSPPPACRSAGSRRCFPPTSRPACPPPACCAGPSRRCTSRPPAGRSCWRSTTPTCSTRRRPRWSTWSPAPSSATVARHAAQRRAGPDCRSAHCGRTIWSTGSSSPRWPSDDVADLLAEMLDGPVDSAVGRAAVAAVRRQRAAAARAGDRRARRRRDHPSRTACGGGPAGSSSPRASTDLIDARIGQLSPGVRTVVELVAFGEPIGLDAARSGRPTPTTSSAPRSAG